MPRTYAARGLGPRCTRCHTFRSIGPTDPAYPGGRDVCKYCLHCANCKHNFTGHLPDGKCLFASTTWVAEVRT